jgi:nucleotide-binding universal stress UspA family protein
LLAPRTRAGATVELVEQLGTDVIVIGTQGRDSVKHVLLSGASARTLRDVPSAVLTAKEVVLKR